MLLGTILEPVDWGCVFGFFVISLAVGVIVTKKAGKSSSEFFLSGRNMPWWLLGVSMVATTFSTDTPNLVTDIVRQKGVAGNWVWWAFLLTGMLTVFVYAKLWRRSGVMTDIEFYELRYSGKPAAFLRGFRALYLGVFFNVVIMATVTLAAIKIGGVLLGLGPWETVAIAAVVTVVYSTLGGLRGVLITDFIQFGIAMFGAIMAAIISLRHTDVGGLANLLSHPNLQGRLGILPDFSQTDLMVSVFIIPLAVQWWSVWYPGSEPGGGGYLVQRMLAAKDEKNAMGATLLFNAAHYALRPWPWIIVALCSMVVYPDLASLRAAFPEVDEMVLRDDLAYPAMLTFLPAGLLGLVVASLIAAYMSTISTHLNWGSSYVVNDFYKRFLRTGASEKELVLVGRFSTLILMLLACVLAKYLENAKQAFDLILAIGAGTGLLFILRWFWWRINPYSELTAMIVSFGAALFFFIQEKVILGLEATKKLIAGGVPKAEALLAGGGLQTWQKLVLGVAITTFTWILITLLTKPTAPEKLRSFYRLVRPGGPGWKAVLQRARADNDPIDESGKGWDVPMGILCMVFGCLAVYSALFATGYWIYARQTPAIILTATAAVSTVVLVKSWSKLDIK
ncbi:MAG: Na+:solute symporter [Phycisphaerae bacterium SM23_30]|nr:MAG: Na+:solute symporter [Phycisphaerae bacterium SM23_30]